MGLVSDLYGPTALNSTDPSKPIRAQHALVSWTLTKTAVRNYTANVRASADGARSSTELSRPRWAYEVLKLYRRSNDTVEYWETWDNDDGSHTVHFGTLGTTGESRVVKSSLTRKAQRVIQEEIDVRVAEGYCPIELDDHAILLIEYAVDGMGHTRDLDKRHRLEDRMNELLGWTGLGACDGGSIGSGTMEVCNFVVDFDLAKSVVAADLEGTEFANYTRIYEEGA